MSRFADDVSVEQPAEQPQEAADPAAVECVRWRELQQQGAKGRAERRDLVEKAGQRLARPQQRALVRDRPRHLDREQEAARD